MLTPILQALPQARNFSYLMHVVLTASQLADPAMVVSSISIPSNLLAWRSDTIQAIIATAVQLFFGWRVRVLTGNIWITLLIILTALVSLCMDPVSVIVRQSCRLTFAY